VIDRYLAEFERELRRARVPRSRRRRLSSEVEDHLRADPDSLVRFGDPGELARRYSREVRSISSAPAALLLVAAVVYVLPLYWIPEHTLPPAPPEGVGSLAVLVDVAVVTFASALVLALAAVCVSSIRLPVMGCSALALVSSSACALAAAVQWPVGAAWTLVLVAITTTLVVTVGLAALTWAAIGGTRGSGSCPGASPERPEGLYLG
jgi:hypothetical protein